MASVKWQILLKVMLPRRKRLHLPAMVRTRVIAFSTVRQSTPLGAACHEQACKRSCEEASAQVDEVARITKRSQVDDAKLADSCNGDGRPLRSMLLEVAKLHQTSRWTSGTRITLVYFTPNTHVTASADARSFLQTKCNFNLPRRSNDDAPLSELIQQWVRVSSIPGRLFQ